MAKKLSWHFHHLLQVVWLTKACKRGGSQAPQDPPGYALGTSKWRFSPYILKGIFTTSKNSTLKTLWKVVGVESQTKCTVSESHVIWVDSHVKVVSTESTLICEHCTATLLCNFLLFLQRLVEKTQEAEVKLEKEHALKIIDK